MRWFSPRAKAGRAAAAPAAPAPLIAWPIPPPSAGAPRGCPAWGRILHCPGRSRRGLSSPVASPSPSWCPCHVWGKFYHPGKQEKAPAPHPHSPPPSIPIAPHPHSPQPHGSPAPRLAGDKQQQLSQTAGGFVGGPAALRPFRRAGDPPIPAQDSVSRARYRPLQAPSAVPQPRSPGAWSLSQHRHRPRTGSRNHPPPPGPTSTLQPPPPPRAEPPQGRPTALQQLLNMESAGEGAFSVWPEPTQVEWEGEEGRAAQRVNPL